MSGNANLWKDVVIKIATKTFAGITSFDFQTAINMIPTTDMNTADRESTFKPGRKTRTLSIEGLHEPTQSPTMETYLELDALIESGAAATIYIADTTTAGKYEQYSALVSNLSKKVADGDKINISASFQISGSRTTGTHS